MKISANLTIDDVIKYTEKSFSHIALEIFFHFIAFRNLKLSLWPTARLSLKNWYP